MSYYCHKKTSGFTTLLMTSFASTSVKADTEFDVLYSLYEFLALKRFGDKCENQEVKFHIDNKAAFYALQNGQIQDPFIQAVAR